MRYEQVYTRAQDENGKWCNVDVMDLDDESFRAFVIGILYRHGLVVGIKDDYAEGEDIKLKSRVTKEK